MKILVFGVSGMLGNAMFRVFSEMSIFNTFGTSRTESCLSRFSEIKRTKILSGVDVENQDTLVRLFGKIKPDVVINCIGLVKQLSVSNDPLVTVPINSLLPHRLAALCEISNARLIHISTDCVFSGGKGFYEESDMPDAKDLYGRSKLLGEVVSGNAITLRTSIIGHELSSNHSLIGWFLAQDKAVRGFSRAVFSGVPTVELARIVRDFVLPKPGLTGLYHVSAKAINKFDLLKLVAEIYGKTIEIIPDDSLVIDRSLNSERFTRDTGYVAPDWPDLIKTMHQFQ